MTDEGKCEACGFTEEDNSLHIIQLHAELTRLRAIASRAGDVEGVGEAIMSVRYGQVDYDIKAARAVSDYLLGKE